MGKISNVLTMLELLSNNRKYSIRELSERLEVSERMIRFYKQELEIAGIYIDTLRGPYGGYVLSTNVMLPKIGFSKYDVDLLENSYKLLGDRNYEFSDQYLKLLDKIKGIYKGSSKKGSSIISANKDIGNKYNMLSKAIKEKKKISIEYLSIDKETKERIIHPCYLYLYNDDWYVSAFCELRGEIRSFELERIFDYKLLEESFNI